MSTNKKTTGLAAGRPSASKQKISMEDEPVLVRINAQVTDVEHQKLKIHAAKNKTSISELLRSFKAAFSDAFSALPGAYENTGSFTGIG